MPRSGLGVFTILPGTQGAPNTTVASVPYNNQLDDFANDANTARPITAGGTGATNAAAARTALGVGTTDTPTFVDVSITGGSVSTRLDSLAAADAAARSIATGGTGSTTAAAARTALGVAIGTNVQAYDATLAAIAGLDITAGFMVQTGTDTFAKRVLFGTANEIIVNSSSGALGDPTFSLAPGVYRAAGTDVAIADGGTGASTAVDARTNIGAQAADATLTALAALDATTGALTQTGADTFAKRTLTGTTSEIAIANATGETGNPTISLPAALAFSGKIITGGTFNSGAFNGSIGATTPSSGAFTTGVVSSSASANGALYAASGSGLSTNYVFAVYKDSVVSAAQRVFGVKRSVVATEYVAEVQGGMSVSGVFSAASMSLTTDLAIVDGGTGASTAVAARTALEADGNLFKRTIITASGTHNFDSKTTRAFVELLGAGGAGAGASSAASSIASAGSGGGQGAHAKHFIATIPAARTSTITIGAGAVGITGHGADGGNTLYNDGVTALAATGGSGGQVEEVSTGSIVSTNSNGRSGLGEFGATVIGGGQRGEACLVAVMAGVAVVAFGGGGAGSPYGRGFEGTRVKGTGGIAGVTAAGYGAGGGGACSINSGTFSGGNGAPGLAIIWEYR